MEPLPYIDVASMFNGDLPSDESDGDFICRSSPKASSPYKNIKKQGGKINKGKNKHEEEDAIASRTRTQHSLVDVPFDEIEDGAVTLEQLEKLLGEEDDVDGCNKISVTSLKRKQSNDEESSDESDDDGGLYHDFLKTTVTRSFPAAESSDEDFKEEFRNDRAAYISKKELHELKMDLKDSYKSKPAKKVDSQKENGTTSSIVPTIAYLSTSQYQQLNQQIQQHTQLLLQGTCMVEEHANFGKLEKRNVQSRFISILSELQSKSVSGDETYVQQVSIAHSKYFEALKGLEELDLRLALIVKRYLSFLDVWVSKYACRHTAPNARLYENMIVHTFIELRYRDSALLYFPVALDRLLDLFKNCFEDALIPTKKDVKEGFENLFKKKSYWFPSETKLLVMGMDICGTWLHDSFRNQLCLQVDWNKLLERFLPNKSLTQVHHRVNSLKSLIHRLEQANINENQVVEWFTNGEGSKDSNFWESGANDTVVRDNISNQFSLRSNRWMRSLPVNDIPKIFQLFRLLRLIGNEKSQPKVALDVSNTYSRVTRNTQKNKNIENTINLLPDDDSDESFEDDDEKISTIHDDFARPVTRQELSKITNQSISYSKPVAPRAKYKSYRLSDEEKLLLIKCVAKYGHEFSLISNIFFPDYNRKVLRRLYERLMSSTEVETILQQGHANVDAKMREFSTTIEAKLFPRVEKRMKKKNKNIKSSNNEPSNNQLDNRVWSLGYQGILASNCVAANEKEDYELDDWGEVIDPEKSAPDCNSVSVVNLLQPSQTVFPNEEFEVDIWDDPIPLPTNNLRPIFMKPTQHVIPEPMPFTPFEKLVSAVSHESVSLTRKNIPVSSISENNKSSGKIPSLSPERTNLKLRRSKLSEGNESNGSIKSHNIPNTSIHSKQKDISHLESAESLCLLSTRSPIAISTGNNNAQSKRPPAAARNFAGLFDTATLIDKSIATAELKGPSKTIKPSRFIHSPNSKSEVFKSNDKAFSKEEDRLILKLYRSHGLNPENWNDNDILFSLYSKEAISNRLSVIIQRAAELKNARKD